MERIQFHIKFPEEITENIFDDLMIWSKNNCDGIIRGYNDTYDGFKKHKYFVFDNWGLLQQFYNNSKIHPFQSFGVDNNPQGCKKELSLEELKNTIYQFPNYEIY